MLYVGMSAMVGDGIGLLTMMIMKQSLLSISDESIVCVGYVVLVIMRQLLHYSHILYIKYCCSSKISNKSSRRQQRGPYRRSVVQFLESSVRFQAGFTEKISMSKFISSTLKSREDISISKSSSALAGYIQGSVHPIL
jgi:hypothetical protein